VFEEPLLDIVGALANAPNYVVMYVWGRGIDTLTNKMGTYLRRMARPGTMHDEGLTLHRRFACIEVSRKEARILARDRHRERKRREGCRLSPLSSKKKKPAGGIPRRTALTPGQAEERSLACDGALNLFRRVPVRESRMKERDLGRAGLQPRLRQGDVLPA
jgi:hypothetical protein